MRRALWLTLAIGAAAGAVAPTAALAAPAPRIKQLVVFRSGSAKQRVVRAQRTTVRVKSGRRCAVGRATPLAALALSHVGKLGLRDFGSCSLRPRDASGLFVRSIGADVNSGQDGWVYKAGLKTGSAGAADPSGPFGSGRLRGGARITWFYCQMHGASCQRTLAFARVDSSGGIAVQVKAYNDRGRGIPAAGVTVHVDSGRVTTDAAGVAHVGAHGGRHRLWAEGHGYVRSFYLTVKAR